jgi:membrane fusion protein (multidrug efflux system)
MNPEAAMSTSVSQSAPGSDTPRAVTLPEVSHRGGSPWPARVRRAFGIIVAVSLAALAVLAVARWWHDRAALSVTDDAFVEAHLVNVAPEAVSGRIVRLLVEENDRVERGQVLAEIDPVLYRDKVNLAASKLEAAKRELARQQADLARLRREVPIQVEIARRTLAAAEADRARTEESLKLTDDDVERGIDEARAARKSAQADLVLAQADHARIANLERKGSSTRHELDQVVRARDAAQAHLELAEAKLAKAVAGRTQVDVARRSLDAARTEAQKAEKGVDLAETGHDQIRVVELLVEVKKEAVEEARTALESAEHDLAFTRVRAPFPGVVVRRYRHLGDFASAGVAVLSMYNPELLYVTANLEETRLPGVAPGVAARLDIDAFAEPFRGRVVWVNKSTGAQFALMPRNVVSGEFTKVVQRVPVRIWVDRDDPRWPQLRAGLSVRVSIAHGAGDPAWAEQAARLMAEIEGRFNQPEDQTTVTPGSSPGDVARGVTP